MLRRKFGNSGLEVGVVGFGAWQLGNPDWKGPVGKDAEDLVREALDHGCNFFDTAPSYGKGQSEILLGRALQGRRDEAVICTKFGYSAEGEKNFDAANLAPALEKNLERLKTDRVDVFLLHNPPEEMLASQAHAQELEKLKAQGKLRVWGVSIDWAKNIRDFVSGLKGGAIEILFNAFHQEPAEAFGDAQRQGVGLVAKVPLDSGWLGGHYDADWQFEGVRDRWSPAEKKRRADLVRLFRDLLPGGMNMSTAALRFAFSPRQMSVVIPGAKDRRQLLANLAAGEAELDDATVALVRDLWQREISAEPVPW